MIVNVQAVGSSKARKKQLQVNHLRATTIEKATVRDFVCILTRWTRWIVVLGLILVVLIKRRKLNEKLVNLNGIFIFNAIIRL